MICRCVGMADEGDSKSLVLITRVGSTPTTGTDIKPQKAQSFLGSFFAWSRGSNRAARLSRAQKSPVETFEAHAPPPLNKTARNCRLHLRWFRAVALPIHLAAVNVQVWVSGMPYGNTAQFPPCGLSTAPAAAARHLRCQNAR